MNSLGTVLVGCFGNVAWIRVEGKGSFENSPRIRRFAQHMIDRGQKIFVADLENCPTMDSTFMGTLVGIALKVGLKEGGRVDVINANERCRELLVTLGLDSVLAIEPDGGRWERERELVAKNITKPLSDVELEKKERAQFVKEAHEALVEANDENFSRFQDVIAFLKQEIIDTDT